MRLAPGSCACRPLQSPGNFIVHHLLSRPAPVQGLMMREPALQWLRFGIGTWALVAVFVQRLAAIRESHLINYWHDSTWHQTQFSKCHWLLAFYASPQQIGWQLP